MTELLQARRYLEDILKSTPNPNVGREDIRETLIDLDNISIQYINRLIEETHDAL